MSPLRLLVPIALGLLLAPTAAAKGERLQESSELELVRLTIDDEDVEIPAQRASLTLRLAGDGPSATLHVSDDRGHRMAERYVRTSEAIHGAE